ncbi:LysR family transcriptional regulator [uncultured Thalassolituus sp.]|nr:LysR family transcriptional regulator [uncultured Thalassolituus sp.]
MHRLNYKHLQYFYTVADLSSIQAAAERLSITPQTISGQLKLLEEDLGEALFRKAGRGLELTDAGHVALEYCRDIFRLGDELQEVMQQGVSSRPVELRVGIVDALPKSITHQLLAPVIRNSGNMKLICREEQMTTLLGELAVHRLDLVLADSPMPAGMNIRCFNHELGRSPMACFARPNLIDKNQTWPQQLEGAPVLLPTDTSSSMRTNLLSWFQRRGLSVRIAGEFDDSALLKAFGSEGHGFFFAPEFIAEEVCTRYGVEVAGVIPELEQTFYAIVAERRITHSAVRELTEQASDAGLLNKKSSP